ncbi:hypothetical protein BX600DRAFT_507976 [Xylariales sp. PMI_506]|nr:hypothetical protein BX600DRAFT_507976 [Xylariales sp. PMI_506]
MKTVILNLALVASLAAAQPRGHGHNHAHFHNKKGSPMEKRGEVVTTVETAVEIAYVLTDGQAISPEDAKAGLAQGIFTIVSETTPTNTAPVTSTSVVDAAFFQKSATTSSSSAPATTSSSAPAAAATSASSSSTSSAKGVDADFPSGEIDCSVFPSDYGAVAVDWLNTGGWTSLQGVGSGFIFDVTQAISNIVEGTTGSTCTSNMFCSYSCPDGYVKAQWPSAQGSTGQSVGGLYCNPSGKLELTRSGYSTLCQKGCGGVSINNKMGQGVSVCRTDYPGSESMVDPTWVAAGASVELTNIESAKYYEWQGKATTLQYYVNPAGLSTSDACVWTSSSNPSSAGNWAPMNIGVGKDSSGITYLSLFANLPTSSASLDFDVIISGDISGTCSYKSGSYVGGSSTGCTVGITDGGSATITFQASS